MHEGSNLDAEARSLYLKAYKFRDIFWGNLKST